jgi:hypothetical protein
VCICCSNGPPNNAGPGARLFEVLFEGGVVKSGVLDLFVLSGGKNVAYFKEYTVTVTDGVLDIGFNVTTDNAQVCGIEIKV